MLVLHPIDVFLYRSLPQFLAEKNTSLALFQLKSTWEDEFFTSYLKQLWEKAAFDEPLSLSGLYRLIVALGHFMDR